MKHASLHFGILLLLALSTVAVFSAEETRRTFKSPDDAAQALVQAAKENDTKALNEIFGPEYKELISTGDEVADKNNRAMFAAVAQAKMKVAQDGDSATILLGPGRWPFPIPIAKRGDQWSFDTDAGKEEILNRRIGRNELGAIGVMRGYVEAQREYASRDHNNDGVVEYAQKLMSDPGTQDGLYWETKPGEESSPLGPMIAQARAEGYSKNPSGTTPYHGYYYKILTAQGPDAPGGAYSYIINGRMVAGYGLVAYPAKYGSSGVMTFMVNQNGQIVQKDLGEKTADLASGMTAYNPDNSWAPVEEVPLASLDGDGD